MKSGRTRNVSPAFRGLARESGRANLLRWIPQVLDHAGGLARPFEFHERVNPNRAEGGGRNQAHDNRNEIPLASAYIGSPSSLVHALSTISGVTSRSCGYGL